MIEGLTPAGSPVPDGEEDHRRGAVVDIFSRKLIIESVAMTDWNMVVETLPERPPQLSRSSRAKTPSKGPSRFTTTLRSVVALRGPFTYEDHGTPWSTVGAQLDVQVYRPPVDDELPRPRVVLERHGQDPAYEPFRADMQSRFTIDNGIVHFDRHRPDRRRPRSVGRPATSISAHWPEQTYQRHVEDRFPDPEGHLLPRSERSPLRGRATSPARSTCSRAAAS